MEESLRAYSLPISDRMERGLLRHFARVVDSEPTTNPIPIKQWAACNPSWSCSSEARAAGVMTQSCAGSTPASFAIFACVAQWGYGPEQPVLTGRTVVQFHPQAPFRGSSSVSERRLARRSHGSTPACPTIPRCHGLPCERWPRTAHAGHRRGDVAPGTACVEVRLLHEGP